MIVKSYLLNHVPLEQLSKDFGVSVRSIRRWISIFADGKVPDRRNHGIPDVKPNPSIMPKKIQKPVESEAEELARLREENKRLAEALKMAEWMNHAKDVMIRSRVRPWAFSAGCLARAGRHTISTGIR